MNTLDRKKIIEQTGFKIINNKIIDIETKEQLTKTEKNDFYSHKYIGPNIQIYIKGINQITINRKNTTIELKETPEEQIITLYDKETQIKVITTVEAMMYKVGSIKIIENTNNKKTEKEYIQRIEQIEINNEILPLETNSKIITKKLIQNINSKKIEILKPLIEENIKKIIKCLNENINKYIKGLEQENNKEKIKILKQYKGI